MENAEIEKEIIAEKKSISFLRIFLLTSMLVIAFCFGYFYYNTSQHTGRQMVEASVFDARLQNLENSIPLHEERIAKLEEAIQKLAPGMATKPAATTTTLTPSSTATPAPAAGDIAGRIAELEKQMQVLKSTPAGQSREQVSGAIALLSSFHRLSDNMLAGRPFASELSAFQENFGTDDKATNDLIVPVAPYAAGGIPTVYRLLLSFDKVRDSIKSNAAAPENAGLGEKLKFNLSQMVTVHRTDKPPVENTPDAIIARAGSDLENEEVEAAIAEIKSLPDNIRGPFDNWLEDAQTASFAPSIVDQLEEKTMKKAFAQESVK